jgi:hypothetical protein
MALPESLEGWGREIPPFAKCAKDGAPSVRGGVGLQQVPHRAFSPVRNDKTFISASSATDLVTFPVVALAESSGGWGCGIPCLAKALYTGTRCVVASAEQQVHRRSLDLGSAVPTGRSLTLFA